MAPNTIGRPKLGAAIALATAMGAHALFAVIVNVNSTPVAPMKTPSRLQMAFVVSEPVASVIEPVPITRSPPSMPPKKLPPVTKKPAAPNPVIQTPPSVPEPVTASPPKQDVPVVAELAQAAIAPIAEPALAPFVAPVFEADYLDNPKPAYPTAARRLRLHGTVVVRVTVTTEGKPSQVYVATSSGAPILDQAALAAVQSWSFVPARRGSNAVYADVDVPIRFSLK